MPASRAWHLADGGLDQVLFRLAQLAAGALDQPDAAAPGQHQERDDAGEQQRKPAALEQLGRIRREEDAVDHQEEAVDGDHEDRRIAPLDRDQRRQQRRDRHQQRHRDAVGAGQRVRGAEADHGAERRGRQQPVHQRHIDLADGVAGGVAGSACAAGSRAGSIAGSAKTRPEMIACEAITVATRRERDQRVMQPVRRELIERIVDRGWGR